MSTTANIMDLMRKDVFETVDVYMNQVVLKAFFDSMLRRPNAYRILIALQECIWKSYVEHMFVTLLI